MIKLPKALLLFALLLSMPLTACDCGGRPLQTPSPSMTSEPITTPFSIAATTTPVTDASTTTPATELRPPVTAPTEPSVDEMVALSEYLPEAVLDIRYATDNNFTGQVIYENGDSYLRYGTVKKLKKAAEMLAEEGYILLIWDAWRPAAAQWKLWEICPDGNYVSDPNRGYSSHTRGGTVDLSLIDAEGNAVPMPTDFDDFSTAADRDYSEIDGEAAANARLLEAVMIECGFKPYQKEWWHYTDQTDWDVLERLPD